MKYFLLSAIATLLTLSACQSPNRTDNLAPVQHDEDQHPGNDNVLEDNRLRTEEPEVVGSVNSYASADAEESYNNMFRRSAEDADFNVVTDEDLDMPHSSATLPDATATPDPDGDYVVRDRVREQLEYGSNRASEVGVEAKTRLTGSDQSAIGAVGTDNSELAEYYDTDEEDYGYQGSDGATGNSWIRVLSPEEKNYNEQVVRVGGTRSQDDYRARYEELKHVLYSIPENQQAQVYAPNNYSYDFVTTWSGLTASAKTSQEARSSTEVAYDRPPLMGTGCEQSDDPISCSTAKLDGGLKQFLNNPRVLASMRRAGIDGVDFQLDNEGNIVPGSVSATTAGTNCMDEDCARFNRSIERALIKQEWTPAMRRGQATVSRVRLPLRYRQTEEQLDLG